MKKNAPNNDSLNGAKIKLTLFGLCCLMNALHADTLNIAAVLMEFLLVGPQMRKGVRRRSRELKRRVAIVKGCKKRIFVDIPHNIGMGFSKKGYI